MRTFSNLLFYSYRTVDSVHVTVSYEYVYIKTVNLWRITNERKKIDCEYVDWIHLAHDVLAYARLSFIEVSRPPSSSRVFQKRNMSRLSLVHWDFLERLV
jgi:hypothetical protein